MERCVGGRVLLAPQPSTWKKGSVEGYRKGLIIGADRGPTGSVWIRNNRGRVVQVSREQVRGIEGEELWTPSSDDVRVLKSSEDDLSRKHAAAFDHRPPGPRLLEDLRALDAAGQLQEEDAALPALLPLPFFSQQPEQPQLARPAEPVVLQKDDVTDQPQAVLPPVPEDDDLRSHRQQLPRSQTEVMRINQRRLRALLPKAEVGFRS